MHTSKLLLMLGCGLAINAYATQPAPALIRADEDWSNATSSAPFKHIALDDDMAYLSLGGELRLRTDTLDAARYGLGPARDSYTLLRTLIHADLRLSPRWRLFTQLEQADAIGKTTTTAIDQNRTDLRNAFIEFDPANNTSLRLGRQDLLLNAAQRFVSVREGPNVRQSFDGLSLSWQGVPYHLKAFVSRPVSYKPGAFDDIADPGQTFHGLDLTWQAAPTQAVEIYQLELRNQRASFGGIQAQENRHSTGMRLSGRHGPWDYDLEGMLQYGHFANQRIRAWGASTLGGFTLQQPWRPRLGIQLDAGSGDDHDAGTLKTFNPLFPKGSYFDQSGLNSWANSVIARFGLDLSPHPKLKLYAGISQRWRENLDDAVYVQPYSALPATLVGRSRQVARTGQLDATWLFSPNLSLTMEALHVEAGPAITQAGGKDVDFLMTVLQLKY